MSKIFAIYPTDERESTQFLNKINVYLKEKLNDGWYCYKIGFNDDDHINCLKQAKENSAKFILFMGHGKSDCLFGSCTKENTDFISPDAEREIEQYYKNEQFIDENNIENFKNKVFFSFSCNSNAKRAIASKAVEKGVFCFVGFGDIPTDYTEKGDFPPKAIAVYKGVITKIIKESLYISIINNYWVERLVDLIKICTYKEIQKLLQTENRHKKIIIEKLLLFKNEIKIFGNRFETVT